MPDVCQISWIGRELVVTGVADSTTQHIEKMVSRQQNSKKGGGRSKKGFLPPRFGGGGVNGNGFGANQGSVFARLGPTPGPYRESNSARLGSTSNPSKNPNSKLGSLSSRLAPKSEPRFRPIASAGKTQTAPINPHLKIDLKSSSVQVERACLETVGGDAVYGKRVIEQLQGRPNGLFSSQVEKLYQKKYEESLPKDWLQVMERAGTARVVRDLGASASPLVYPALFRSEGGTDSVNINDNNSASINSISSVPLPTTAEWDLTICSVSSTNVIHIWLADVDTKLASLHDMMLSHHRKMKNSLIAFPSPPELRGMYSALIDGDKLVRRVKVMQVDKSSNTCRCFMLDYGNEVVLSWKNLVRLDEKFQVLPAQAVKASLAGVADVKDGRQVEFVRKYLEKRRLVGVVVYKGSEDTPALVLFDTSQEEDIMVSDEIIKYLSDDSYPIQPPHLPTVISNLATPRLPGIGEYFDLVVSHIVSPSLFYVQSHSCIPAYSTLTSQMTTYYSNNTADNATIADYIPGALYALAVSKIWHRAILVKVLSPTHYCMRLVDSGRMVMTSKEMIKPLPKQFKQLPIQAIKSKLASVKAKSENGCWDEESVEWYSHVALNKSLVGLVEEKDPEEVTFTMYDTSLEDIDIIINSEMLTMGLALKK